MFLFTLVNSNGLPTRVAIFCKHAVKTGETVRPSIPHDVSLASKLKIALVAGKVLHVPGPTLGLGALVRKYDLENRFFARLSIVQTPGQTHKPKPPGQTHKVQQHSKKRALTSSQAVHLGFMVSA
jgi:hypothetical protein